MVRTASTAVRASGGKSTKAVAKTSGSAFNASSSSSSEKSGGGGNSVHPRETPSWQKPISNFFKKSDRKGMGKSNYMDMRDVCSSSSSSSIPSRDVAEAGSSKDIYKLRNVHIDNNNDEEAGYSNNNNNNNNGSFNNNNNNNVPDHNSQQLEVNTSDNPRPGSSNESMDVDTVNPGTSGYQRNEEEEASTSSFKNKENLEDNKQSKKRSQEQAVVENPPKKLKPEFYKYLEDFESLDR